jgi:MOSC domain-containing protein YiiM
MSLKGRVVSIFIRPEPSAPVVEQEIVHAVPGKGLQGDYYYAGKSLKKSDPSREVTLFEKETLTAIKEEFNFTLKLGESRRNIITENVTLNQMIGKEFRVGKVRLKGIRQCQPCTHLVELTQKDLIPALVHRGGLRAQILTEGQIRVGDPVYALDSIPAEEANHAQSEQRS